MVGGAACKLISFVRFKMFKQITQRKLNVMVYFEWSGKTFEAIQNIVAFYLNSSHSIF